MSSPGAIIGRTLHFNSHAARLAFERGSDEERADPVFISRYKHAVSIKQGAGPKPSRRWKPEQVGRMQRARHLRQMGKQQQAQALIDEIEEAKRRAD